MMLGKIAFQILDNEVDSVQALECYRDAYLKEMEILNKVVNLWYKNDFSISDDWMKTAGKISKIFGREIGQDVEAFRWISNLENVHRLYNNQNLDSFLDELQDVNNIKSIREFEAEKATY